MQLNATVGKRCVLGTTTTVDAICDDFEAAILEGKQPQIEEFLARAGDDSSANLLTQLLLVELDYRQRRGETPVAAEYMDRFAGHHEVIERCLQKLPLMSSAAATPSVTESFETGKDWRALVAELERPSVRDGSLEARVALEVLKPHATGGLGEVYVAFDATLNRSVAVKRIRDRFANDPGVRQRFLREAAITGSLQHPGVVPIHAAGINADGSPFYAMRFIEGESFKDALGRFHASNPDFASLQFRQLLGRFVAACNAIAYAHSKGVIHRDIKPANIMLGAFGETLVVDWGIAKVVGGVDGAPTHAAHAMGNHPDTAKTGGAFDAGTKSQDRVGADQIVATELATRPPGSAPTESDLTAPGQLLGTPAYMSPEQVDGSAATLTPQADVYSLGATLYTLLTGRSPFNGQSIIAVLKKVCAGDFALPRSIQPLTPAPLAAVCTKAMALDPTHRYGSALELAADIEQWLADEPVGAYVEPWVVKAARWVKRHRSLVSGLAALILAAVPLSIVIAINRQHALRQSESDRREIARQKNVAEANEQKAREKEAESLAVLAFVEDRVFAAARPEGQGGGLGRDVPLRLAIEAALPYVDQSFKNQPLVEAYLRTTLGTSFRNLGEAKIAAEQDERARTLRTRLLGPDHPDTLVSVNNLAGSYDALGQHADALKLREATLAKRRAVLGDDHPQTLESMKNIADSFSAVGQHAKAIDLLEKTLAQMKAKLGAHHPHTVACMSSLASSLAESGRFEDALRFDEETLAIRKETLGIDHPDTLMSMSNLAESYADLKRRADALKLREQTLALRKVKLGPDHPDTLQSMNNLAASYFDMGQLAKALPLFNETLKRRIAKLGPDHPQTLRSMMAVADTLLRLNRGAEALPLVDDCLARAAGRVVHPVLVPYMMDLRLRHFEKQRDAVGCTKTAEMWEKLHRVDADSLYVAACMRAIAAAVVAASNKSQNHPASKAEADRAMAWLKQALAAGFDDLERLEQDADLAFLRVRDDFKKTIAELKESKKKTPKPKGAKQ